MRTHRLILLVLLSTLLACQEKEFDLANPQNSYITAKKPYEQGNYEIALAKLGEFKTRFPYSSYAIEAELLIANAYFELSRYPEAVVSYEHFIKLHPRHEQVAFAQYRIGESYWQQAPTAIDREQELTAKALQEWEKLLAMAPTHELSAKAQGEMKKGRRRIAEAEAFVANFYCRQKIWHACAYRNMNLAEKSAHDFKDIVKKALEQAAYAFDRLANEGRSADTRKDANLFVRAMSADELRQRAMDMRAQAKKL